MYRSVFKSLNNSRIRHIPCFLLAKVFYYCKIVKLTIIDVRKTSPTMKSNRHLRKLLLFAAEPGLLGL